MNLYSRHFQKLEALIATGMPGAYKVLVFFLIQYVYDIKTLGAIASWQSIAQIIGFFTAIGWAALILVRVAKADTTKERVEEFNKLSLMAGATLVVCCLATLAIGAVTQNISDSIQIVYWIAAWSFYQIPRHYQIALRAYRQAIAMDIFIIFLSICAMLLVPAETVSFWLALSMLFTGAVTFIIIQKGSNTGKINFSYEIKGLEFGLVNFLSGGISLSLIPLAAMIESEAFVGVLSLFVSTMGIALLIPRAISLNQMPKLAKIVDLPKELASHSITMRKQITLSNLLTSLACIAIGLTIAFRTEHSIPLANVLLAFLLIILQSTLSTQGLINSNILACREKSRSLLKINAITSIAFFLSTALLILNSTNHAFIYICLSTVILTAYRLHKTKYYVTLTGMQNQQT